MKNYYDILGLKEDCTQDDVKAAFRRLSKVYHPDVNNGSDDKFREIKEAYDVLYDKESRDNYDVEYNCSPECVPFSMNISHDFYISLDDFYFGATKKFKLPDGLHTANIMPHSIPGTKVIMKHRGWNGGDLELTLKLRDNDRIWLDGLYNIHIKKDISWIDAILGCEFQIDMFKEEHKVRVPAYSTNDTKLCLLGRGYPVGEKKTNLIVELNVLPPNHLSDEQIELMKKIKEMGN